MGDLFEDTAVLGEKGQYTARIARDWAAFGPNGGYLAAMALRAAGSASQFARPASFSCHYLGPADFDTVQLSVRSAFSGERAESLHVSMKQRERPILDATVWTVGEMASGFDDHDATPMPSSPPPETLTPLDELPSPSPPSKFWRNIDQRLIGWQGWHTPGEPKLDGWYRYRPRATMPDVFAEAARAIVLVDVSIWLAAMNPYITRARRIAPTMDLDVRFYHPARTEWLRCHARSDVAFGGLIDGRATIWSSDGKLVAQGGGQMIHRTFGAPLSGPLS